jgi:ABC-type transport system involved in multi-copper enzyme maturation permease subunit
MSTPQQPHPAAPAAAPGAPVPVPVYVSPIPVRRAHLGDAISAEWTKIRTVRSTLWTLGVMLLLLIGIGFLASVAVSASDAEVSDNEVLALGFFGVLLGSVCVMTLGVLTVSSEYGTGLIRTTLTACPSRVRVLTAKAIVYFLVVFTVTAVTTSLVAAFQVGMLADGAPDSELWFRSTLGVSLYIAFLGLLALAVGSLIRHSAGGITLMIGVVLLPLVLAMFMVADSLTDVRDFLFEYSVPSQLMVFYEEPGARSSGPQGWEPLWVIVLMTAVAMGGAIWALNSRDV